MFKITTKFEIFIIFQAVLNFLEFYVNFVSETSRMPDIMMLFWLHHRVEK